jgi:hypothetical protein
VAFLAIAVAGFVLIATDLAVVILERGRRRG